MYLYLTGPVWLLPVITLLPDRSGMTQILSQLQTGLVAIIASYQTGLVRKYFPQTRPVWWLLVLTFSPDQSGIVQPDRFLCPQGWWLYIFLRIVTINKKYFLIYLLLSWPIWSLLVDSPLVYSDLPLVFSVSSWLEAFELPSSWLRLHARTNSFCSF